MGFALWCEGNRENELCSQHYSAHFNLWAECSLKPSTPILDIGLKFKYQNDLKRICLYIPYEISKSSITDLGKIIVSDKRLLDSVFNENYVIENINESKQYAIKKGDDLEFIFYTVDSNNDFSVEKKYDGTIVTFDLTNKSLTPNNYYYFRFRCDDKSLRKIIEKKSTSLILESVSTENNFIDFRLNDWRSLVNESLVERIQTKSIAQYCIDKINFFLMTKGDVDVYSLNKKSERKLEKTIWKKYSVNDAHSVIIASQWQDKVDLVEKPNSHIESFNVYAKFKKQWCTPSKIIKYLAILLILNVIYSLVYNYLFQPQISSHPFRVLLFLILLVLYIVIDFFVRKR